MKKVLIMLFMALAFIKAAHAQMEIGISGASNLFVVKVLNNSTIDPIHFASYSFGPFVRGSLLSKKLTIQGGINLGTIYTSKKFSSAIPLDGLNNDQANLTALFQNNYRIVNASFSLQYSGYKIKPLLDFEFFNKFSVASMDRSRWNHIGLAGGVGAEMDLLQNLYLRVKYLKTLGDYEVNISNIKYKSDYVGVALYFTIYNKSNEI